MKKSKTKEYTRLNDIASRQPEYGGYERVITNTRTCIQSIKTALNSPLYDTDYKKQTYKLFIEVDRTSEQVYQGCSVIISNIAEIFSIEYLDSDILFK